MTATLDNIATRMMSGKPSMTTMGKSFTLELAKVYTITDNNDSTREVVTDMVLKEACAIGRRTSFLGYEKKTCQGGL